MLIKPLTGQVLVEILPPDKISVGGIAIPEHTKSPEEHQEAAHRPEKPRGLTGTIIACGGWPKTRSGLFRMPEFSVGMKVVVSPNRGLDMQRLGNRLRMVSQDDILAVVQDG